MTFSRLPYNFEEALAEVKSWRASHVSKREWVGLTDEDCTGMSAGDKVVAMWADRTLKEKNNG